MTVRFTPETQSDVCRSTDCTWPLEAQRTSCPASLKLFFSRRSWQISPSTTSIFIFLSVEKFVDLPTHLLSEDQQRTLPALVKNTLAVSLKQLVERSRSEFPLGGIGLRDFDFGSVADDLAPEQLLAGLVLTICFSEDFPQQLFFP
jgi:hypothetical protein